MQAFGDPLNKYNQMVAECWHQPLTNVQILLAQTIDEFQASVATNGRFSGMFPGIARPVGDIVANTERQLR